VADDKSKVEIGFSIDLPSLQQGFQQAEQALSQNINRINQQQSGENGGGGFGSTPSSFGYAPPPLDWSNWGNTGIPTSGHDWGAGFQAAPTSNMWAQLHAYQQQMTSAPDIAQANLHQLYAQAITGGQQDPDQAREYQKLADAIRDLKDGIRDHKEGGTQNNQSIAELLRLNLFAHVGTQVAGNFMNGNLLGGFGGLIGGGIGLLGGPAGMMTGSAIGSGIGSMAQGFINSADEVRQFEMSNLAIAGKFGDYSNMSGLRQFKGDLGYSPMETAGLIDQLRQGFAVGNSTQGESVARAIQENTRALGLNTDAVVQGYTLYTSTGGTKGADGFRDYMEQIVSGAIAAGMQAQTQQYSELMSSARMQSVMSTAAPMSNKAFAQLNDVAAALLGGNTDTAKLFRENPHLGSAALGTYASMGGTNDPYSMQAGFMRVAGVNEAGIDRRFSTPEQQMTNSQRVIGFGVSQLQQMSGMSSAQFNERAASDPDFVKNLLSSNVTAQRFAGDFLLPGMLGREASAADVKAFSQLANITAANGGQLPSAGSAGSAQIDKLLKQLGGEPGFDAMKAEQELKAKQMEVMQNFLTLRTDLDKWQKDMLIWVQEHVNFKEVVGETKAAIAWVRKEGGEFIAAGEGAFKAMQKWAKDNNLVETMRPLLQILTWKPPWMTMDGVKFAGKTLGNAVEGAFDDKWLGDAQRKAWNWIGGIYQGTRREGVPLEQMNENTKKRQNGIMGWLHDRFNDTPPGGVVATAEYNTFKFAPGDRVTAVQTGGSDPMREMVAAIQQAHTEDMGVFKAFAEYMNQININVIGVMARSEKANGFLRTIDTSFIKALELEKEHRDQLEKIYQKTAKMQGDVSNLVILQQQQVVGINAINANGGIGGSGVGVSDSADLGIQGTTGHSTGVHAHVETDPATFDKMVKNAVKRGYKVYSVSDGNQLKLITNGADALPHHLDKHGNRKANTWDVVFEDAKGNQNVPIPSPFDGPSVITDQGNDPTGYGNFVEATDPTTGKKIFVGHLARPAAAKGTQLTGSAQASRLGQTGGAGNMAQYLRRIAAGESSEGANIGSYPGPGSDAPYGEYQFRRSTRALLQNRRPDLDPWSSNKSERDKAAIAWIEMYGQEVGVDIVGAINRGDFETADRLLGKGQFTSLPGGGEESPLWRSSANKQKYGPVGTGGGGSAISPVYGQSAAQPTYTAPSRPVPQPPPGHRFMRSEEFHDHQKPHSGFGGQTRGDARSSSNLTIHVHQTIANRSDAEVAGKNAKEGLRAGLDHFGKDWEAQTKLRGNQARPTANAYG
jgi:hypothetical protein